MYKVVEDIQAVVEARFNNKYVGDGIISYSCFIDEIRRNTMLLCNGNPHADKPTYMLVALLYKCFEPQYVDDNNKSFVAFGESEMYHHLTIAMNDYIKDRGKPYTLFNVHNEVNNIISYAKVLGQNDKSSLEYMEVIKSSNHIIRTIKLAEIITKLSNNPSEKSHAIYVKQLSLLSDSN